MYYFKCKYITLFFIYKILIILVSKLSIPTMDTSQINALGDLVYNDRDISPAQLKVTSRQINYWLDNKIVPFVERQQVVENTSIKANEPSEGKVTTKTKWIRLNLAQAVWVCIVKELLSFGVTIEQLKELALSVWQKPREEKYADKVFEDHIAKNLLDEYNSSILKSFLEDEMAMKYHFRTIINPFTDLVKSSILREGMPHAMLYAPKTNDYVFHSGDNGLFLELGSTFLEHPMVCIPLMPILSKVLAIDFGNKKKDLNYLNNIEKQIRDIVVFKKPKAVHIAFEDGYIKPITVTEQHKTREALSRYILENKIAKGSKLLIDIRNQDNYKITLIKK